MIRRLPIDPDDLLVVGNDSCLYRRLLPGSTKIPWTPTPIPVSSLEKSLPHFIITQNTAKRNVPSKGTNIVDHIGGPAKKKCLLVHHDHGNRRLRRNAGTFPQMNRSIMISPMTKILAFEKWSSQLPNVDRFLMDVMHLFSLPLSRK